MSTALIVVLVVVGILVLLAVGGAIAAQRRRPDASEFAANLEDVNRALAQAHAEDKGWEPGLVAEAARRVFSEARPGAAVDSLTLVAVHDRPGTDDDQAVFRVTSGGAAHELTLGRSGGDWVLAGLR